MESFIKVTLNTGVIAATLRHKKTVLGLGLKHRHASRILKDTPAIRGMAKAVRHLVKWEKVKGPEALKRVDPFGGVPEYELGAVKALPKKEKKKAKAVSAASLEMKTPASEEEHPKKAALTHKKTTKAVHTEGAKKTPEKPLKKVTKKVKK